MTVDFTRIDAMSDEALALELKDLLSYGDLQATWFGRGLNTLDRFFIVYQDEGITDQRRLRLERAITTILAELASQPRDQLEMWRELILNIGDLAANLKLKDFLEPVRKITSSTAGLFHRGFDLSVRLQEVIMVLERFPQSN